MTSNPAVRTRCAHPRDLRRAAAAVLAAALLATGCSSGSGGPGVASVGSTGSPTGSATNHAGSSMLAYSQCMRTHGVPKFPDPGPNGDLRLQAGPGTGIDPRSSVYKAAEQACQALRPTPPAAEQQQNYQALLKYSSCMRSHGIKDFPDPQPDGRMQIQAKQGSDLDPNSALFRTAQQACQKYLPGGGKGGGLSTGNG